VIYWGKDVEEFKPECFINTYTYRWPRGGVLIMLILYYNALIILKDTAVLGRP
jgi:hypothetical protein